ncbi:MAG: hypothetical protein WAL10_27980, partial [Acetobacteraceae bacterium]
MAAITLHQVRATGGFPAMHHRLLWLATAATALLLQACAQQPSRPPPRVFAADMTGAAKVCTAPPVTPTSGHTVDAAIK